MAQNPDLHLWRAVLVAGLHDAARGIDEAWLHSPDFALVCDLALVDPVALTRAHRPERFERKPPRPRRSRLRDNGTG